MSDDLLIKEIDRLKNLLSDLETERQELIERGSLVPIGAKVLNIQDNEYWTVTDIDYAYGKFSYVLENDDSTKLQQLSECNVKFSDNPFGEKNMTMSLRDDLVSVKLKK